MVNIDNPNKSSQHKDKDITYRRQGKKKPMPAYADYVVDGGLHIPGYLLSVLGNRKVAELFQNGQLQSMLKGNQSEDAMEKQADEIAEEVVKGTSATDQYLERVEALMEDGEPRRKALEAAKKRMNQLASKGNPLNKTIRDDQDSRYGVDFAQVRIHKDKKANEMAEALNARAFTHKNDIYFNKGEYKPDTPEGKKLLAHELVHTMQPGEGIQRKEKDQSKPVVENGWFVTEEKNSLFIEFKPLVTDEAIKIETLFNKIVGGTATSEQTQQIFDALKAKGIVKGSLWSSYTFMDTLVLDGRLVPRGKVDVGFLYELEFLKKPEGNKASEEGAGFFKGVGDFFKGIGDAYFQSLMAERDKGAAFSGKKSNPEIDKGETKQAQIDHPLIKKILDQGVKMPGGLKNYIDKRVTKKWIDKYKKNGDLGPGPWCTTCMYDEINELTKVIPGIKEAIYPDGKQYNRGANANFEYLKNNHDAFFEISIDTFNPAERNQLVETLRFLANNDFVMFVTYYNDAFAYDHDRNVFKYKNGEKYQESGHFFSLSPDSEVVNLNFISPNLPRQPKEKDYPLTWQAGSWTGIVSGTWSMNGWLAWNEKRRYLQDRYCRPITKKNNYDNPYKRGDLRIYVLKKNN